MGEGPIWHPTRARLYWFDILANRFHTQGQTWQFDRPVSAAGWIDHNRFLIASATDLFTFDIETGQSETVIALEADNSVTRSNDGRADPWGGFWVGTMGLNAEQQAGAIYRFFDGVLRRLVADITIPNAICFSPDRRFAFYTDTHEAVIYRQGLNQKNGWPDGPPLPFVDLSKDGLHPDGAVCDSDGGLWNAQWGAGRVARYRSDGGLDQIIPLPTDNVTCPAFGGPDLQTLFVTSASVGLERDQPQAGRTFALPSQYRGQREHQVIL
ncbi:MAG TPA: SMP-30/gluconolactonase/LRE family protein [Aliiroseovarius sp.]|nr:SMP-30/gluconolactonase/LRE family protein [Aliiroseovarius sp.]